MLRQRVFTFVISEVAFELLVLPVLKALVVFVGSEFISFGLEQIQCNIGAMVGNSLVVGQNVVIYKSVLKSASIVT